MKTYAHGELVETPEHGQGVYIGRSYYGTQCHVVEVGGKSGSEVIYVDDSDIKKAAVETFRVEFPAEFNKPVRTFRRRTYDVIAKGDLLVWGEVSGIESLSSKSIGIVTETDVWVSTEEPYFVGKNLTRSMPIEELKAEEQANAEFVARYVDNPEREEVKMTLLERGTLH